MEVHKGTVTDVRTSGLVCVSERLFALHPIQRSFDGQELQRSEALRCAGMLAQVASACASGSCEDRHFGMRERRCEPSESLLA